jgi:hypothetical protein
MTRPAQWVFPCLGVALVAAVAGCNSRTPMPEQVIVTAPTEWVNATVPAGPAGDLAKIEISPTALIGGGDGRGTVFLDGPSPHGGLVVSLATDSSGTVGVNPSVVIIPAGSFSAAFSYTTTSVTADADVSIVASTAARSRTARLALWAAVLPSFHYHVSEMGDRLPGPPIYRTTSDVGARFRASCNRDGIEVSSTPPGQTTYTMSFGAAGSQPLLPGVYENATAIGSGHQLRLEPPSLQCRYVGRFEIRELDTIGGDVTNIWIVFEASCPGVAGTFRGEFRATNLGRTSNRIACSR